MGFDEEVVFFEFDESVFFFVGVEVLSELRFPLLEGFHDFNIGCCLGDNGCLFLVE